MTKTAVRMGTTGDDSLGTSFSLYRRPSYLFHLVWKIIIIIIHINKKAHKYINILNMDICFLSIEYRLFYFKANSPLKKKSVGVQWTFGLQPRRMTWPDLTWPDLVVMRIFLSAGWCRISPSPTSWHSTPSASHSPWYFWGENRSRLARKFWFLGIYGGYLDTLRMFFLPLL